jgi:hypothetical protein
MAIWAYVGDVLTTLKAMGMGLIHTPWVMLESRTAMQDADTTIQTSKTAMAMSMVMAVAM